MSRSSEETMGEFAKYLEMQLGVSLATQKLVCKGKNLLSENKDQKLSQMVSYACRMNVFMQLFFKMNWKL